ncbi:transposase, MuDR, plant [Tanacetum coccineum]
MKALQQYETCLEDHYGMLCSYASEILNSNPGSTCKMGVDSMPDRKNYFSRFYVCFKGLKEGWLQGCRRAVVNVENKDNWSWLMELLINDLGLVSSEGLTIISDQRKKYTGVQYKNLFWKATKATYSTRKRTCHTPKIRRQRNSNIGPESWSRAYFTTNKACDVVENGISECFNALIVDARRKPIINMLEDIRVLCMERLQKMREKHEKYNDGICPNIRKKLEKYMDLHRHWNVIPNGESRFEVRNGYEGFKVDERSRTCTCRGWQLFGIPYEHGIAAIYFLHGDPENYVSEWYNKDVFVNAYNHYIEGINGN